MIFGSAGSKQRQLPNWKLSAGSGVSPMSTDQRLHLVLRQGPGPSTVPDNPKGRGLPMRAAGRARLRIQEGA
jgi:hypothetical protein